MPKRYLAEEVFGVLDFVNLVLVCSFSQEYGAHFHSKTEGGLKVRVVILDSLA